MTTGERIKARRKQLSISADELAERVGVSRSTVFRWENGDVEKIPAVELNKVAAALQTTDEYLFGFIDDPDYVVVREKDQIALMYDERRIVDMYRELNKEGKTKAFEYLMLLRYQYRRDDDATS